MAVSFEGSTLVDWTVFSHLRSELGTGFGRVLGYFREDGFKSVDAVEIGMRAGDVVAMIHPAYALKAAARQFGAEPLADIAEAIEFICCDCVEKRETCEQALQHVVALRPMFEQTLGLLEREANPLARRQPGFGKRSV